MKWCRAAAVDMVADEASMEIVAATSTAEAPAVPCVAMTTDRDTDVTLNMPNVLCEGGSKDTDAILNMTIPDRDTGTTATCVVGNELRDDAIEHMKRALSNYAIAGISHNITFLETIMRNNRFCSGEISTNFIKEEFSEGFLGNKLDSKDKRDLISTAMFIYNKNFSRNSYITGRISKEKKQINNRWVVMLDEESYLVEIISVSDEELVINCDNTEMRISSHWRNGNKLFKATVNNAQIGVNIRSNNRGGGYLLQHSGSDVYAQVLSLRNAELYKFMPKIEKNPKPTELTSPITGKIVKFKVKEGQEVKAGQELVIIEAMKMENIIRIDYDVKIKKIEFSEGEAVGVGQVVMTFA